MQKRLVHTSSLRILEAISVLVFLWQALRVIFSVVFGIIYDQIFEGQLNFWLPVSNLLVIAALLAPALAGRRGQGTKLSIAAMLAALARAALTINDPVVRYWCGLIVLAAGGVYLATLLMAARRMAFTALIASLALDQVLRVVGHTYDISLRAGWLPIQGIWSASVIAIAIWLWRDRRRAASGEHPSAGIGLVGGLALGGWMFVESSLLALPNVIARWSDGAYPVIAPVLLALTLLPLLPPVHRAVRASGSSRAARLVVSLVFALGLMLGYFLDGTAAVVALLLAQASALTMAIYILDSSPSTPRPAGLMLALGLVLLLVLNFANAFAFTYPYTLPAMRGMGWAVYLAAALVIGAGAVIAAPSGDLPPRRTEWLPIALGGLAAVIVAIAAVWPRPVTTLADSGRVRVGTYNIHYGYDDAWHLSLEWIAQTIEETGADIVALQEVDTGRMTSYGIDDAYYLARRLRMRVEYLPTVEHLTGIALLYRDPATATGKALVTSQQEQTGVVLVRVEAGGERLNAYGIWMGLEDEDTQTQIREALAFIGDAEPAVFGGDFNARPGSPVARAIEAAGFADPFAVLEITPAPLTSPAPNSTERIDFVWVRGVRSVDAWVPDSVASDHRMVVIEVDLFP